MKAIKLIVLSAALGMLQAEAQTVPGTLSYQGILMSDAVTPVPDAPPNPTYTVVFNFYTAATGGSLICTRTVAGIETSKGLFTCIIGGGTGLNAPFSATEMNDIGKQPVYIGINVNGAGELSPRAQLTPAAYAFQAQQSYGVDFAGLNSGTVANSLRFGSSSGGEAIGSKRTATGNQFGLDFYTNSLARMSISNAGGVGIGTMPVSTDLLYLNLPSSLSFRSGIGINNDYSGASPKYGFMSTLTSTGTNTKAGFYSAIMGTSGNASNLFGYYSTITKNGATGTTYGIYTAGEDHNYFSGSVGIGTSPGQKLHVMVPTGSTPVDGILVEGNVNNELNIEIKNMATNGARLFMSAYPLKSSIQSDKDLTFATSTSWLERMRITAGGNVGIGEPDPGYPLDVNGYIRTSAGLLVEGGSYSGGSIELSRSIPYIDFHFNGSGADFTSRIYEYQSGKLGMEGSLDVVGDITPNTSNTYDLGNTAARWRTIPTMRSIPLIAD